MASGTSVVGNVSDLLGAAEKDKSVRKTGKELGKDAFLQLLVQQLKNQDPMKPMEDSSFIAEMAQFSSLEQMQNLNKTMANQQGFAELSQASALIGKSVKVIDSDNDGAAVKGVVDEVRGYGGTVKVVIGGKEYDATAVNTVYKDGSPAAAAAAAPATTPSTAAPIPTPAAIAPDAAGTNPVSAAAAYFLPKAFKL